MYGKNKLKFGFNLSVIRSMYGEVREDNQRAKCQCMAAT